MQKRLLISGIVFVLIMGAGYGIMQFTGNEEPSSAGMPAGIVVTADAAQKETMPQTTADQSVIATDTCGCAYCCRGSTAYHRERLLDYCEQWRVQCN